MSRHLSIESNLSTTYVYRFITDIDECLASPCKNGAQCTNTDGSYTCTCASGWQGQNCDIGICSCSNYLCVECFTFSTLFLSVLLIRLFYSL